MLSKIFEFLDQIKKGLSKPDARITVEVYDMGNSDGLKFEFKWYEEKLEQINVFIPKDMIEYARANDEYFINQVIYMANFELEQQEAKKQND